MTLKIFFSLNLAMKYFFSPKLALAFWGITPVNIFFQVFRKLYKIDLDERGGFCCVNARGMYRKKGWRWWISDSVRWFVQVLPLGFVSDHAQLRGVAVLWALQCPKHVMSQCQNTQNTVVSTGLKPIPTKPSITENSKNKFHLLNHFFRPICYCSGLG